MKTTHTQAFNSTRKPWSVEEENIVLNNVKKFPDNLRESFRLSEKELEDRNLKSIEQKYYQSIRAKHPHIISIGSAIGFTGKNVKNRANKSDSQETPLTSKLKPFQRIVVEMLSLSEADRNRVIEFFK